jgi:hypothetical protein
MNGMCFIPLSPDEVTLLNSQRVKDDNAEVEIVESDDEFKPPPTTEDPPNEEDALEDKKKKKVVKKRSVV